MPSTLDYVTVAPPERKKLNVPAIMSVACGAAGFLFALSKLAGIWRQLFPALAVLEGAIAMLLAIVAIVSGTIGALQAPRESPWYRVAMVGYSVGLLIGAISPFFWLV